ncbi:MAG: DegV family protein [Erysipelotrichia bacterium]|nr:DegV family protein [Erysipelotrichia bacterium]
MSIKIYTDAGSNLFPSVLKKINKEIKVVSMQLTIDEVAYRCYDDDIDPDQFSREFYQKMRDNSNIYTSQVNPNDFIEAFKEDIAAGHQIICFTLAKGISGTYNSACLARDIINEEQGKEVVYVVDSATAGFGEGLQAIRAAELVKKGWDFEAIIKEAEEFKFKVRSEFTVGDIKYLIKKGRVSALVAKFINMINIRFLLKGSVKSTIEVSGKVFGRKTAIRRLADTVVEKIKNPDDQIVYISHCDVEEEAISLKNYLIEKGIKNIKIYYYDLITGAHIGPDSIAIFYVGENRD